MGKLTKLFDQISDDHKPQSTFGSVMQVGAAFVAPLYGVGAVLNRLAHATALKKRERLEAVVLSVGNITVGGTGKSTFTIWLAEALRAMGRKSAILSRGYGRDDESRLLVVHDGKRLRTTTNQAGDEPVMMATILNDVPVIVCAERVRAGALALQKFPVDTLILDDGFQHHALDRQGDIVLFDCTRPPSSLRLFPRGTLREPVSTLQRAHLIVLTRWNQGDNSARVLREIRSAAPSVPVARTKMVIAGAYVLGSRASIPLDSLAGKSAIAVCGIGNPRSFRRSIESAGMKYSGMKKLDDHGRMTKEQVLTLDSLRRRKKADYLVVTEKDAVKLEEVGTLPKEIIVLQQRLEFLTPKDEALALRVIKARLRAGSTRGYLSS